MQKYMADLELYIHWNKSALFIYYHLPYIPIMDMYVMTYTMQKETLA